MSHFIATDEGAALMIAFVVGGAMILSYLRGRNDPPEPPNPFLP